MHLERIHNLLFFLAELTAAHFGGGGGLLRKKVSNGQQDEEEEKPKSRKELIEEMIAKSKQEKVSFLALKYKLAWLRSCRNFCLCRIK